MAGAPLVKRGLFALGHYRRVLRRSCFPGVAVLGYHGLRADDLPRGSMPFEDLHVRASTFDAHCRVIRDTCDPISLDDWRAALAGRAPLPPRPVLITFDDGYRSVFTIGASILAGHRLPAVMFLCSEPIDRRRLTWFDAVAVRDGEAAVEAWKERPYEEWLASCAQSAPTIGETDPRALMSPEEVSALSRQGGIEFGGHTARHAILARAGPEAQRAEITDCQTAIEKWTGRAVRAFAYPNGRPVLDFNETTMTLLGECGFDFAFTTRPSFATPDEPRFERSRFLVLADYSAAELAHQLAYSWRR